MLKQFKLPAKQSWCLTELVFDSILLGVNPRGSNWNYCYKIRIGIFDLEQCKQTHQKSVKHRI